MTNSELCLYKQKILDASYDSFVALVIRLVTSSAVNHPTRVTTTVDYLSSEEVLQVKTGEYWLGVIPQKRYVPRHAKLINAFVQLESMGYGVHIEYVNSRRYDVVVTHECTG